MRRHRAAQEDRPAILIVSDGVIAETVSDTHADRQPVPCAIEGLRVLSRLNLPIILLAQDVSAVRALLERELADGQVRVVSARMSSTLSERSAHAEDDALVRQVLWIAQRYKIALATSVLIGESWASVRAALASGCQPVLVMTGRGHEQLALAQPPAVCAATWFAADLVAAALAIEARYASTVRLPVA